MIHPHRRWEDLVAGFHWDVPEEFNFGGLVDAWATDRSRLALYWADEAGREAHLQGKVAMALMEKAKKGDLFAKDPEVHKIGIIADKLPH